MIKSLESNCTVLVGGGGGLGGGLLKKFLPKKLSTGGGVVLRNFAPGPRQPLGGPGKV